MSDYEYEYDEPNGFCESCGIDLDADPLGDHDEHHRLCWTCWRGDDGPERDAPAGGRFNIADRRFERLLERLHDVELRVGRLEHERRMVREGAP